MADIDTNHETYRNDNYIAFEADLRRSELCHLLKEALYNYRREWSKSDGLQTSKVVLKLKLIDMMKSYEVIKSHLLPLTVMINIKSAKYRFSRRECSKKLSLQAMEILVDCFIYWNNLASLHIWKLIQNTELSYYDYEIPVFHQTLGEKRKKLSLMLNCVSSLLEKCSPIITSETTHECAKIKKTCNIVSKL